MNNAVATLRSLNNQLASASMTKVMDGSTGELTAVATELACSFTEDSFGRCYHARAAYRSLKELAFQLAAGANPDSLEALEDRLERDLAVAIHWVD